MIMAGRDDDVTFCYTLNSLDRMRMAHDDIRLSFALAYLTETLGYATVFSPLPYRQIQSRLMSNQLRCDVLRVYGKEVLWLRSATNVQHAIQIIEKLEPGDYIIIDHDSGNRMVLESHYKTTGAGQ